MVTNHLSFSLSVSLSDILNIINTLPAPASTLGNRDARNTVFAEDENSAATFIQNALQSEGSQV